MYRVVDEAAAAASNEKRRRRGRNRAKSRPRNRPVRQRKTLDKRLRVPQGRQQTRPTAPPLLFDGDDFNNKLPVLGSLVPDLVKPLIRPLQPLVKPLLRPLQPLVNVLRPSTPPGSDTEDEPEPPVPPRTSSLYSEPIPKATRKAPPVPPRRKLFEDDEGVNPPPASRRQKPARRSSMVSRSKAAARKVADNLAQRPHEAMRNLSAKKLVEYAEKMGLETDDPFTLLGFRNRTLEAAKFLRKQGLVVKLGSLGWDIIMYEDSYDSDDSTWDDAYGPQLRF